MGGGEEGVKPYRWSIFYDRKPLIERIVYWWIFGDFNYMVAVTTGQGSERDFSFGATRITDIWCQETAHWHQPKREDYYPSHFSESAKLTNDPMCVTESHWLKNQQCIVYRFQSGLCPCAAFTWTWRWTCGATSTAGENLTYKVKSRPFKFHDSITVSQMLANLSGVEFKIIVPKFWKR